MIVVSRSEDLRARVGTAVDAVALESPSDFLIDFLGRTGSRRAEMNSAAGFACVILIS